MQLCQTTLNIHNTISAALFCLWCSVNKYGQQLLVSMTLTLCVILCFLCVVLTQTADCYFTDPLQQQTYLHYVIHYFVFCCFCNEYPDLFIISTSVDQYKLSCLCIRSRQIKLATVNLRRITRSFKLDFFLYHSSNQLTNWVCYHVFTLQLSLCLERTGVWSCSWCKLSFKFSIKLLLNFF